MKIIEKGQMRELIPEGETNEEIITAAFLLFTKPETTEEELKEYLAGQLSELEQLTSNQKVGGLNPSLATREHYEKGKTSKGLEMGKER